MDSPSFDPTGIEGLVDAARGGEVEAIDQLVRHLYPELYRWALLKCGEPADAEDITQDAAITMHRQIATFGGRSRFTTWAYRIVSNAVADFYRRNRRHVARREPAEVLDDVPQPAEPMELKLASDQFADLVRRFFADLSENQRTVFYLVDLQGYAPKDAAEMLDANPNTVRVHLLKARRAIRRRLLEHHPEIVEELNGRL